MSHDNEKECAICYDNDLENELHHIKCNQCKGIILHIECLKKLEKIKECPYCRGELIHNYENERVTFNSNNIGIQDSSDEEELQIIFRNAIARRQRNNLRLVATSNKKIIIIIFKIILFLIISWLTGYLLQIIICSITYDCHDELGLVNDLSVDIFRFLGGFFFSGIFGLFIYVIKKSLNRERFEQVIRREIIENVMSNIETNQSQSNTIINNNSIV